MQDTLAPGTDAGICRRAELGNCRMSCRPERAAKERTGSFFRDDRAARSQHWPNDRLEPAVSPLKRAENGRRRCTPVTRPTAVAKRSYDQALARLARVVRRLLEGEWDSFRADRAVEA